MITADQVLANHKAQVEALFEMTNKAFEGVEKVVELNLQVAKASMGETAHTVKAALSAKDAQELLALQQSLLQPAAEKAAAYSRHLYDIAAATGSALTQSAENQLADVQGKWMAAVDSLVQNAPAGTENVTTMMKSAMTAANTAYESAQKAAKQASDIAEANFQALTTSATKATKEAVSKARRATAV